VPDRTGWPSNELVGSDQSHRHPDNNQANAGQQAAAELGPGQHFLPVGLHYVAACHREHQRDSSNQPRGISTGAHRGGHVREKTLISIVAATTPGRAG